jgi:hypothetical protein
LTTYRKVCVLVFLSYLLIFGCSKKQSPIPEKQLATGPYADTLNTVAESDFLNLIQDLQAQEIDSNEGFSPYGQIPQYTDIASDAPKYHLYHEPKNDSYWINAAGGFLGQNNEWYGPLQIDISGEILIRAEK